MNRQHDDPRHYKRQERRATDLRFLPGLFAVGAELATPNPQAHGTALIDERCSVTFQGSEPNVSLEGL
jgi:hypothetical protein